VAPGGAEPPHADSKFLEKACCQVYSVLSGAVRFSQFCQDSAVRDTVGDTLSRLPGQRISAHPGGLLAPMVAHPRRTVLDSAGDDLSVVR
jgi:hypothetical protein